MRLQQRPRAPWLVVGSVLVAGALVALGGQAPEPVQSAPEVPTDFGALERTDLSPAPLRIALQAGHWKAAEAPDELAGIRSNGTRGGGKAEWEVTLEIARHAGAMLEDRGYLVDILPATIPPRYRSDLFVAIHADGHDDPSASGFSVAAPRRGQTAQAGAFALVLAETYRAATALRNRPVTRRMQGYYAFNSRRYEHTIDPSTVGVIIETGFLTNPGDRAILLGAPERSAKGIVDAVARFLPLASTSTQPGR